MRNIYSVLLCASLFSAGCAEITVKKITPENDTKTSGIRYALPKPFLQVSPQPDGTIAVDVLYLPDLNNTYAVDTWGWMSSSTFQVALDSGGLLSAIEFKQNTSAVGQQVAAGAGAATSQLYNMQAQQIVANQTAVNAAQSNAETAKATSDGLKGQLATDTAAVANAQAYQTKVNADPNASQAQKDAAAGAIITAQTQVNTDNANFAQAQAKYQDAQQTLNRTQTTAQAVAVTAAPGAALTTTSPPTPGTTGFGPQTWTIPPGYDLPQNHGAVLFAINDWVDLGHQ